MHFLISGSICPVQPLKQIFRDLCICYNIEFNRKLEFENKIENNFLEVNVLETISLKEKITALKDRADALRGYL